MGRGARSRNFNDGVIASTGLPRETMSRNHTSTSRTSVPWKASSRNHDAMASKGLSWEISSGIRTMISETSLPSGTISKKRRRVMKRSTSTHTHTHTQGTKGEEPTRATRIAARLTASGRQRCPSVGPKMRGGPATATAGAEPGATTGPVGLMDKASASGAGDSRFESWAGHYGRET